MSRSCRSIVAEVREFGDGKVPDFLITPGDQKVCIEAPLLTGESGKKRAARKRRLARGNSLILFANGWQAWTLTLSGKICKPKELAPSPALNTSMTDGG